MNFETGREMALIGMRLLDDTYMAWEAAEIEADQALRAWSEGRQHQAAYQAYCAAVDREEAAAHDLERLHELIESCTGALVAAD